MALRHLHPLDINAPRVVDPGTVPAVIAPLLEAATRGGDVVSVVTTIIRSLGFDTITYGMSTVFRPGQDSVVYSFTTMSQEWVRLYHQEAYIEIDPRIEAAASSLLPYIWDQSTERGKSARVDEFLDNAARYGLCSGVSFLLPDRNRASVILCLNSTQTIVDAQRRNTIVENFGEMFTFGYHFHEMFMRMSIDGGMPPPLEGAPLTARERECLVMAAHGLTTDDVAERLGIKPRTAQFHFDSIRTKLAVSTRSEAIARAVKERLINI